MDLSIIIPSYNTKELLQDCLTSVFESLTISNKSFSFEVIVVDNASTDGSPNMVKNEFPHVKLIANKKNFGYGKANNLGVSQAHGKYILLLNSDIKVLDNGIENLYKFVDKNVEVDIAGAKLLNTDHSLQYSCGPFYNLPVTFAVLFLFGDRWGLTRYSPERVKEVDWVSGACVLLPKKIYKRVGGFDERVFMYMEEIDFLYRSRSLGYRAFFYPEARFIHHGAASSGNRKEPVLNIYRGLLYFYRKHKMGWELFILQLMLMMKANIGYLVGILTNNKYLKRTYKEALAEVLNPKS